MVGVTGTMISLIPNMGSRVLGGSWITDPNNILPLFLSIIILFGTIFLTICFLMIFSRVLAGRHAENIKHRLTLRQGTLITWYEGDFQRSILLFCMVPMWFGLVMFFILLMPMIPNKYSWFFAAITGLVCIPLLLYSFLGWTIGKTVTGKIPGMNRSPMLSIMAGAVIVIGFLLFILLVAPALFDNPDRFSGDITIRADPQYFSPQISSAKGLRLDITNLSGRQLQASRYTWSADYGYFIRVIPSTSEVTILGNPVTDEDSGTIYWTYSPGDPDRNKKPVKIDLHIYPLQGTGELAASSLYLTWYTGDIVSVNRSFAP
nr:hypothetical protein [uncultured Methanoregula sp.]